MAPDSQATPPLAFRLDEARGASELQWDRQRNGPSSSENSWIHLATTDESHRRWAEAELAEAPELVDALLAEETRPRVLRIGSGVLVILRGVNLNPGASVEDMVSLRLFLDESRLITATRRNLFAVRALVEDFEHERGPTSSGEAFLALVRHLFDRIEPVIFQLEEQVDQLEEEAFEGGSATLANDIARARRQVIGLRRYLGPQREAWASLLRLRETPFDDQLDPVLHDLGDTQIRFVEELDQLGARAAVVSDQVTAIQNDRLNQRMLTLAAVTAVFLPLGLLTGLLGINVGGMPGADHPGAFWFVCSLLVAIVLGQLWWLRRRGWF